jgi:tetratricopeptide (TPR) repeat protein
MTQELSHKSLKAKWRAYGLNPQFRFCRYEPGQKFAAHYDGNFAISSEDKSFYTFMIYLNGGFDGGATNFLSDSATPPRGRVLESLAPEAGMLLVFQHNIYHEGEELRGGLKYMMRSDVMYRLEDAENQDDSVAAKQLAEAQELVNLAEQLEYQGRHSEAIQLYKKAYKLAPQLEHGASSSDTSDVAASSNSS